MKVDARNIDRERARQLRYIIISTTADSFVTFLIKSGNSAEKTGFGKS